MPESDLPNSSSGGACPDREELFGLQQMPEVAALASRTDPANQRHWELRKSGCALRRHGSIALRLRTARAGTPRHANLGFHKAARRFFSSISHFATPMIPACHGG